MNSKKTLYSLAVSSLLSVLVCSPVTANNIPFAHDVSIRNAGASGSISAFINDSFSPYVNPAGLGLAKRQEISGLYYNLFMGSLLSSVSYALPLLDAGTIGVSMAYFSSGDINGLDENNRPTSAVLSESYVNLSFSYGITLFRFFSPGMTIKYLNHTLTSASTGAYGIDLGAIAELPYNMRLSVFLENAVKPEFTYASGASDTLPVYLDATLSGVINALAGIEDSLKLGAGAAREEYNPNWGWHAGFEYSVYSGLCAVRLGIKESGFSLGGSLSYEGATFDYAYVKTAYDFIHRFSLSYSFGQDIRALEQELKTKEDKLKYGLVQEIKEDALSELKTAVTNNMTAGNAEAALAAAQKALAWDPGSSWFKEKIREINNVLNKDKKDRLLLEADRLMKENSYIDALVALKNVLDLEPENKDAKEKSARAAEFVKTLGEKNMSVETGNKDSIKKYFETGLDYYASGEYEKAVKEWDAVILASPMQKQVYEFIGKAKEKVRKAQDQTKNIEILKQQKISGLYNEAVVLHTQGKFEESINKWKLLLELDPANAEAKAYLQKVTEEYKKIQRQNLGW